MVHTGCFAEICSQDLKATEGKQTFRHVSTIGLTFLTKHELQITVIKIWTKL